MKISSFSLKPRAISRSYRAFVAWEKSSLAGWANLAVPGGGADVLLDAVGTADAGDEVAGCVVAGFCGIADDEGGDDALCRSNSALPGQAGL